MSYRHSCLFRTTFTTCYVRCSQFLESGTYLKRGPFKDDVGGNPKWISVFTADRIPTCQIKFSAARSDFMLTRRTFILRREMLAITTEPNGKRIAVTIPQGERFRVLSGPRPDNRRMVDVLWSKRTVVVFADDIEHCTEVLTQLSSTPRRTWSSPPS